MNNYLTNIFVVAGIVIIAVFLYGFGFNFDKLLKKIGWRKDDVIGSQIKRDK